MKYHPTYARLGYKNLKEILDNHRFKKDLRNIVKGYQEVLKRIQ